MKRAIAGYSGLVSMVDENVGNVCAHCATRALWRARAYLHERHGDNVGARGLWGKSTLYEESAGVPHHGRQRSAAGRVIETPVSHIDCAPTILEAVGAPHEWRSETCLARVVRRREQGDPAPPRDLRIPCDASIAGAYMLRFGRYKYCHYSRIDRSYSISPQIPKSSSM